MASADDGCVTGTVVCLAAFAQSSILLKLPTCSGVEGAVIVKVMRISQTVIVLSHLSVLGGSSALLFDHLVGEERTAHSVIEGLSARRRPNRRKTIQF